MVIDDEMSKFIGSGTSKDYEGTITMYRESYMGDMKPINIDRMHKKHMIEKGTDYDSKELR